MDIFRYDFLVTCVDKRAATFFAAWLMDRRIPHSCTRATLDITANNADLVHQIFTTATDNEWISDKEAFDIMNTFANWVNRRRNP